MEVLRDLRMVVLVAQEELLDPKFGWLEFAQEHGMLQREAHPHRLAIQSCILLARMC